jgi:membrane protein required for colicin V production
MDWIIIAMLAGSVLTGLLQGLVRSVFAAAGLIGGLILAAWNYQSIGLPLTRTVQDPQLANAIGFLIILITVLLLGVLLGSFLSHLLHEMGLGCLDRIAGALFGLAQGILVITVGILITLAFYPTQKWLADSRLPPYFFRVCHLSTHVTPNGLAQKVQGELKILEEASPDWMHRQTPDK